MPLTAPSADLSRGPEQPRPRGERGRTVPHTTGYRQQEDPRGAQHGGNPYGTALPKRCTQLREAPRCYELCCSLQTLSPCNYDHKKNTVYNCIVVGWKDLWIFWGFTFRDKKINIKKKKISRNAHYLR